jgi:hypothetical protein
MNATQLPFLVEGILILTTMIVGYFLGRGGKPYGKAKLAIHVFLYAWFTTGFGFIVRGLCMAHTSNWIWVPVVAMGSMILVQLGTGIAMMAARKVGTMLPKVHIAAAVLLVLSDICAYVFAG